MDVTFKEIFEKQAENQREMLKKGMYDKNIDTDKFGGPHPDIELPIDCVELSSYHIQQLVSEVGEVLTADKRWKNFRNDQYQSADKLEEIADLIIVSMNIAMYSGFDAETVEQAILDKLSTVAHRIEQENK